MKPIPFILLPALLIPAALHAQRTVDFGSKPQPQVEAAPSSDPRSMVGKGLNGKKVTISGYVVDKPRYHESKDRKYSSWSFKFSSNPKHKHGDEYILATYHEKLWGRRVGKFKYKSGEKISFTGEYREREEGKAEGGLVGSFKINNYTYEEVKFGTYFLDE